jgi:hypothetical protein
MEDENVKKMSVDKRFATDEYIINKHNRIGDFEPNDTFEEGRCRCERLDQKSGWGMNLLVSVRLSLPSKPARVPVFFINLDKDVERLAHIRGLLHESFGHDHVFRIRGVEHDNAGWLTSKLTLQPLTAHWNLIRAFRFEYPFHQFWCIWHAIALNPIQIPLARLMLDMIIM